MPPNWNDLYYGEPCVFVQVVHEALGIVHGCITTVHNVTGTQPIIDMAMTKKKVCLCVNSRITARGDN